jgi:uncharacterized protein YodC (DUF2158 family)
MKRQASIHQLRKSDDVEPTMADGFDGGDVVYLKSGGSAMIVESQSSDGFILCKWHSDQGLPQSGYYRAEALTSEA